MGRMKWVEAGETAAALGDALPVREERPSDVIGFVIGHDRVAAPKTRLGQRPRSRRYRAAHAGGQLQLLSLASFKQRRTARLTFRGVAVRASNGAVPGVR